MSDKAVVSLIYMAIPSAHGVCTVLLITQARPLTPLRSDGHLMVHPYMAVIFTQRLKDMIQHLTAAEAMYTAPTLTTITPKC